MSARKGASLRGLSRSSSCSVRCLLAVVAVAKRQRNDRYSLHWSALSIILLLLSLDEVASIHEAIGQQSERLLHAATGLTQAELFLSLGWYPVQSSWLLSCWHI